MRAMYFLTPYHNNVGGNAQAYCLHKMLSEFFALKDKKKYCFTEKLRLHIVKGG
jgi:hypothetical protein